MSTSDARLSIYWNWLGIELANIFHKLVIWKNILGKLILIWLLYFLQLSHYKGLNPIKILVGIFLALSKFVQMGFYDMQLVEKDDLPFDNKVLWQAMCTHFTIILKTFIKVYCIRKGKNGTLLYQSKISCRCQKIVSV